MLRVNLAKHRWEMLLERLKLTHPDLWVNVASLRLVAATLGEVPPT